jgi:DNA polymerase I
MILLDVTYKGNDDVVTVLWGRGETFEDAGFLPYIYVIPEKKEKPGMVIEGRKIVRIEEVEMKDLAKKVRAWKIFFRHPKDVGLFRSELKEFGERRELDIPFTRRYMIDRELIPFGEVNTKDFASKDTGFFPKILAFDIETLSSSGVQIGADPVIMASFFSDGFEKVIGWGEKIDKAAMVVGEKELIAEIAKTIEDFSPDVLVSYNGDGFDWPYLEERARKLKIPFKIGGREPSFQRRARDNAVRIRGIVNIDIYSFVRNILSPYMQSETLKLDSVAGELLGEGKVKIGGARGITEAWAKTRGLRTCSRGKSCP